jgi:hypothetical protein
MRRLRAPTLADLRRAKTERILTMKIQQTTIDAVAQMIFSATAQITPAVFPSKQRLARAVWAICGDFNTAEQRQQLLDAVYRHRDDVKSRLPFEVE